MEKLIKDVKNAERELDKARDALLSRVAELYSGEGQVKILAELGFMVLAIRVHRADFNSSLSEAHKIVKEYRDANVTSMPQ